MPTPPATATVGEVIAAFLERCGLTTAFGVISIHNMPILDAFNSRIERSSNSVLRAVRWSRRTAI